ncbi:MAG: PGL/p-HBAD biosynthesis glycosyltransferase [candidate division WS6 bacterium OLB20]|uniref:PGL/p-HBAD biosynthesis glycosyltransferase n=1 Tax=candidate division WS6 bacterium OLB20 TaxID=1617426 RepID=A0A136LW27_9BACT|nr:MAG: PGL/p-HBAD biosynthesis glycosyltransferase [candidate division WS6 bacterium OLB20]
MKITVIVNTLNRPESLALCLESLRKQTYKDFEVVVVDQSRNRRSKAVCKPYNLKYYRIRKRNNLSVSRNYGINMAAGDVLAFIDDDAQAREDWIERIAAAFSSEEAPDLIAGRVIDVSDPENPVTQFQNGIVSSFGYTEDIRPSDERRYGKGHAGWYLRPMGANMILRKQAAVAAGGFDEFYEYIHDETDIAVRLIKNGGTAVYDDQLIVEHNPALGRNRKKRGGTNWFALAKNNLYFALKNGTGPAPLKILRALWRVLGGRGPYATLLQMFVHRRIWLVAFVFNVLKVTAGIAKGFNGGLLKRRRTRTFGEPTEYVLFAKRHE